MVEFVQPKAFLIAQTEVEAEGLSEFLDELGAPKDWDAIAASSGEELVEVAGRFCYKSFGTDLNPNVTKVRNGNKAYIDNVLKSKHGSVLEHASVTMGILNVSRVFTHELVRHRAGTAFSQESLRYVRLDKLAAYYPRAFQADSIRKLLLNSTDESADWVDARSVQVAGMLEDIFTDVFEYLEKTQLDIAELLDLDECTDFTLKKQITSAMRRLAPIGLATGIIMTGNHRTWRHVLEMRVSGHAEEEINQVIGAIARELKLSFPSIYQDVNVWTEEGLYHLDMDYSKI